MVLSQGCEYGCSACEFPEYYCCVFGYEDGYLRKIGAGDGDRVEGMKNDL